MNEVERKLLQTVKRALLMIVAGIDEVLMDGQPVK